GRDRLARYAALRHGRRRGKGAADVEAVAEDLPHVPYLVQVAPDEAGANRVVIGVERAGSLRRRPALERPVGGLRREATGLDRVVDALERRDVDEAGAVAAEQQPGRVQLLRQREEAAGRDRLRAPLDALAALEQLPDLRVRLQLLEDVVDGEVLIAVVEPCDEADREHVAAHR